MSKFLLIFFISFSTFASFNDWYQGSVADAFTAAKKEQKPLFLYWGAIWCPPCNQMKKTVFSTKQFAESMKNYIPVYLDGDSESAQIWGEKLGSRGYPTMLVMNASGEELMRMPTGLPVTKYLELLNQASLQGKKLDELLELAKSGKASPKQWSLIASYSWSQNPSSNSVNSLKELWSKAPNDLDKSQLLLQYLSLAKPKKISKKQVQLINKVVNSKDLTKANLENLSWSVPTLLKESLTTKELTPLKDQLLKTLTQIRSEELSSSEKLMTLYPYIIFEDPGIEQKVATEVSIVDKETKDAYSRQSAISDGVYLLIKTKQLDKAYTLANKELKISHSPFYFMSYLGMIEEERNNKDKALAWYEKAWHEARGDAAKFQWGTSYLIKAMKLTPTKQEKILKDLDTIVGKVITQDDAFKGRNLLRVEKLAQAVDEWKKSEKIKINNKMCSQAKDQATCKKWF